MLTYIALGSNLGDRAANIAFGLMTLKGLGSVTPSPLMLECDDETGLGPPYLNTVAALETGQGAFADPRKLLEECLRIELACGRDRSLPPNSPRPLDLDLIMAKDWEGAWIWEAPLDLTAIGMNLSLILPHPRAAQRPFVQRPLKALLDAMARGQRSEIKDQGLGRILP